MTDKLKMEALNALATPLIARFIDGGTWPVRSIHATKGLIDVMISGQPEIRDFEEVTHLLDGNGIKHEADDFRHDEVVR
ncbi:MAG: hypothetical protein NW215_10900 [Hyphomicrobiales bacterium]|nr:hypothetical protein [Hyphomicrobiales bacterium]